MDKELMSLFWALAENEDDQRINAINNLLSILNEKQKKTKGQSKELEYTLKRLVKGLASNRKWARLGYAVALTQMLRKFSIITVQDVNQTMKEELKILKHDSKSEQSNIILGRVMASLCLVQAEKLAQADGSEIRRITELFYKAKKEKPPLHQICTQGLVQLIAKVSSDLFTSDVWPVLEEDCQAGWQDCHPDVLLLMLTIRSHHKSSSWPAYKNLQLCQYWHGEIYYYHYVAARRFQGDRYSKELQACVEIPDEKYWVCDISLEFFTTDIYILASVEKNTLDKSFLKKHWDCKSLISDSSMDKLGNVLAKSTADHPVIHPLCDVLLMQVAKKPDTFTKFWTAVIDGFLLNQPLPKKYLCLQLIPKALTFVTLAEHVKVILSPNLLGLVVKQLPNKQQPLNSAVKQLLLRLVQQMASYQDDDLQVTMVTSMLRSPNHVQFDHLTKTTTLTDIVRQLRGEATETFARMLMDTILGDNKLIEDSSVENDVVAKWAVQTLASLVTQVSKATDSDWQVHLLEFLFLHGFFKVKKTTTVVPHSTKTVGLSWNVVDSLQENFFRSLNRLSSFSPGKGGKSRKHYTDVLRKFITFVQKILPDQKHFSPHKDLTKDASSHLHKIFSLVGKIKNPQNGASEGMGTEEAFELLFIHLGLKLFTDPKEGIDALQDLYVCYEKAFQNDKKKPKKDELDESEEPAWVEVVTDLLLSLLVQKSHLVRSVVKTVFTLLSGNLTSPALALILDVLRSSGGEEESAIDFEDEEEEADDGGDEGMMESEEGTEGDEDTEKSTEEASESESDESSEEEVDETEVGEEVEDVLKKSVKSALGKAAVESSEEASDGDLSDSEMEKLDSALAAAFKSMKRGTGKSEEKLRRVQLKHYKMRCLDLIEVLIQNETSAAFLLEILEPLLHVLEQTQKEKDMRELYHRATVVYHSLVAPRKLTNTEGCDKSLLADTVQELVTFSTKVTGVPMVLEVGRAIQFVTRVMLGMDNNVAPASLCPFINKPTFEATTQTREEDIKNLQKVHTVIKTSVQDYCQKRESLLNHMLFHEILGKQTVLMWPLMKDLLQLAQDNSIRVFCRTHVCSMMATMISKNTVSALGESCWRESALQITAQLTATFNAALEEKHRKPKFIHDVLLVLHKVFQNSSEEILEEIVPDSLLEDIESAKDQLKTRDLKGISNRLSQLIRRRLHIEQPGQSKRKEKKRKQELRELSGDSKKLKLSDSMDSTLDSDSGDNESETELTNHRESPDSSTGERKRRKTSNNQENGETDSKTVTSETRKHKMKKKSNKNKGVQVVD